MIVRIVSIVPVVSKKIWDDWDDRDDWGDRWFPNDRLDRPKEWELTVVSKIPGPDNRTLARDSQTKWRMLIEERISSRAICLFFQFCAVEEVEEYHEGTDPDGTHFFFLSYRPYAVRMFLYFFSDSAASTSNFSPIFRQQFNRVNLFL